MMDPQQELFSALLVELKNQGMTFMTVRCRPKIRHTLLYIWRITRSTYDFGYKNAILADVSQTIHVWHNNIRQRGKISNMLLI